MTAQRRYPLIAMPFVFAVQAVAVVAYVAGLLVFGLGALAIDATARSEDKCR